MALRAPLSSAAKRATCTSPAASALSAYSSQWRRGNATVAPQVGSKGPTAMVFMNMGGPSTTDEVHGFLSMLFVRHHPSHHYFASSQFIGRQRFNPSWSPPKLYRPLHRSTKDTQDPETVRRDWRRIANSQMVRISSRRNVQDPR